jgi:hypothetical protein
LQEVTTSITYYDVDGKNIGNIDNIITENNLLDNMSSSYGNVLGNVKLSSSMMAVFRLTSNLKAIFGVTFDKNYPAFVTSNNESSVDYTNNVEMEYRLSDYNAMSLFLKNDHSKNKTAGIKYTHNLRNSIKSYISVEKQYSAMEMDQNICEFGLSYSFGGSKKDSKLPQLFKKKRHLKNLTLPEISPIESVNADDIM